jgi:F0F1-type ATP synthase assembly protein I
VALSGVARGARAAAFVTQMAVITVVGGWLGNLADSRLGTEPWLVSAGFITGFAIGVFAMLKGLLRTFNDEDSSHPPE